MANKDHYFSHFPDVNLKVHTISESLRRHLYVFKTTTGTFSYKKIDLGTKVLIKHMRIPKKTNTLLDLGCGYGPIGIVLGYQSPQSEIYFIDINRRAIWATKENIKLNLPQSQDRLHVLTGDYFEPISSMKNTFDGIYMNPPMRRGKEEFINVCKKVPEYLKSDGFFQFVIRRKMGASSMYDILKDYFSPDTVQIICKRSGYWVFYLTIDKN
ncbi:MAG: class I SAM-dependent methyltransferase [Promethearchaeota archaeon]|nr:MAG: class I SAM-dependent methyltransferase [Candidatus Lokiarchaeota archaeon]